MNRISKIDSVLRALSTGLQNSTAALELQDSNGAENLSIPYSRRCQGLLSLPNEVLCLIAKEIQRNPPFMIEHYRPCKILPFSQTCRTVREVMLSFPALWATVSTEFPSSQVQAFLSRSQDLPLVVTVDIPASQHPDCVPAIRLFLNQVLQHSHRWRALYLTLHEFVPDSREVGLLCYLGNSVGMLPALQTLSIDLCHSFDDDEVLYESEDFHFYKSWTMPTLDTFSFSNFIPHAVLPLSVTSVDVSLNFGTNNERDPSPFLHFLQSTPQIRNLKLGHLCCGDSNFGSPVILDALQSLEVMCDKGNDVGNNLMSYLVFPNLKKLKVLACVKEWNDFGPCIESLFDSLEEFEKVDSFVLHIARWGGEDERCDAGLLLAKVPNLKDLTVDVRYVFPPVLWGFYGSMPPDLRSVRMTLGAEFDGSSIFSLLEGTKVESLEFTRLTSFIQSKVQERMGAAKLTWKEEIDPNYEADVEAE